MAWNYNGYGYNQYMPQMVQPQMAQPQMQQNAQNGFLCRPVTSRAEAEVFQIPFDGSTTYFVDTANGKIYAKTFNFSNGTAPLVTYIPEAAVPAPKYATLDDLNALRNELMGGTKHDESE
jgi:hypothetical protein